MRLRQRRRPKRARPIYLHRHSWAGVESRSASFAPRPVVSCVVPGPAGARPSCGTGPGRQMALDRRAGRCRRLARRPCERSHPDSSRAGPSCGNLRCRLEHIWRRSTAGPNSRSRPRHIGSKSAGISGNACSSDSQHVRRRAGRIRMTLPLMTIG